MPRPRPAVLALACLVAVAVALACRREPVPKDPPSTPPPPKTAAVPAARSSISPAAFTLTAVETGRRSAVRQAHHEPTW
jgi:hypothetical protein